MSKRQHDAAKWGSFRWGNARWGVASPVWQKALQANERSFYRRVANWYVTPDATTGWRDPTFNDQPVTGILVEKGQRSSLLPAGVYVRKDALLLTLDGFTVGDQLWDKVGGRYYGIVDEPETFFDTHAGGVAYRIVHLRWLPDYVPSGPHVTYYPVPNIPVVISGDYHLCVLPNEQIIVQPLAPYSLCTLGVEYVDVSPDSAYSLCVQANDYETPSPASEYWLQLLPMGEDFDPAAGWTWDVESGNWSVVAEGVTGNCYHEDSGAGVSHSDLTYIRPLRATLEVLVENGVNDAWAGIQLYTGADCIEMRYYPRKYEQSLLTSNAAAGQKVVAVADGTRFYAGYFVTLVDGGDSENIVVGTIVGNTLTMQTNLVNSYHILTGAYCWRYYSEAYIYNESSELLRQITDWASDMWLTMQIDLYRGSTSDAYVGAFKAYIEGVQLNKDAAMATVTHRHTNLGCSMFPFDKISLITSGGSIGRFDDLSLTYQTALEATE